MEGVESDSLQFNMHTQHVVMVTMKLKPNLQTQTTCIPLQSGYALIGVPC